MFGYVLFGSFPIYPQTSLKANGAGMAREVKFRTLLSESNLKVVRDLPFSVALDGALAAP